jgi:hypothetical protein
MRPQGGLELRLQILYDRLTNGTGKRDAKREDPRWPVPDFPVCPVLKRYVPTETYGCLLTSSAVRGLVDVVDDEQSARGLLRFESRAKRSGNL